MHIVAVVEKLFKSDQEIVLTDDEKKDLELGICEIRHVTRDCKALIRFSVYKLGNWEGLGFPKRIY